MNKSFKYNVLLILFLFSVTCCRKSGNDLSKNIKWSSSIESSDILFIQDMAVYKDLVIIMYKSLTADDEHGISAYDKDSGDLMWKWNEAWSDFGLQGVSNNFYIYSDELIFSTGNFTCGINAESGITEWTNESDLSGTGFLTGVNDDIFRYSSEPNLKTYYQKLNLQNKEWSTIFSIEKDSEHNHYGSKPFAFDYDGNTHIAFINGRYSPQFREYELYNFNVTANQLHFKTDTIPMEFLFSGIPHVRHAFDGKTILLSNDAIYGYDAQNGQMKWRKYYENSFHSSSPVWTGESYVLNNESKFLIGVNPDSGFQTFMTDSGGSATDLVYNKGKFYISGATNERSKLMVCEANSGNVLYQVTDPFKDDFPDLGLDRGLAVDPESENVYVFDGLHLICFDFE